MQKKAKDFPGRCEGRGLYIPPDGKVHKSLFILADILQHVLVFGAYFKMFGVRIVIKKLGVYYEPRKDNVNIRHNGINSSMVVKDVNSTTRRERKEDWGTGNERERGFKFRTLLCPYHTF